MSAGWLGGGLVEEAEADGSGIYRTWYPNSGWKGDVGTRTVRRLAVSILWRMRSMKCVRRRSGEKKDF